MIFLADLRTPPGLAMPLFYVAPILISLWAPRRQHTVAIAYAGIAFTVLGYVYTPPGREPRLEAANRLVCLLAILSSSVLSLLRREGEDKHLAAYEILDRQVQQHNNELTHANKTLQAEISERKTAEKALRQLSNHLLHLQDDERRRIARRSEEHTSELQSH